MTTAVKHGNAIVMTRIWFSALCLVYAVLAFQLFTLVNLGMKERVFDHLLSFQRVEQSKRAKAVASSRAKSSTPEQDRTVLAISILLAAVLVRYLHLKLSVSASDRNRLATLKSKVEYVSPEKSHTTLQYEHNLVTQMLIKAGVVSEAEAQEALELSRATHRLLGDCLVSFDYLSHKNLESALQIQQQVRAGELSAEAGLEKLAQYRVPREIAFQKGNEADYKAPRVLPHALTRKKRKAPNKAVQASENCSESDELAIGESAVPESVSSESATVVDAAVGSVAVNSVSVESAPLQSAPVESVAVESGLVESAPVESAPVESAPVESATVEPATVEYAPVESGLAKMTSIDLTKGFAGSIFDRSHLAADGAPEPLNPLLAHLSFTQPFFEAETSSAANASTSNDTLAQNKVVQLSTDAEPKTSTNGTAAKARKKKAAVSSAKSNARKSEKIRVRRVSN